MRIQVFALVALVSLAAAGQTLSNERQPAGLSPAMAKTKSAMKQYLEDMTERRLAISTTVTEFDLTGATTRTHHYHRWSEVTSLKRMDDQGGIGATMRTRVDKRLRYFESTHTFSLVPVAEMMSAHPTPSGYMLDSTNAEANIRIRFISVEPEKCAAWRDEEKGLSFQLCGEGEIITDAAGNPLKTSFTAFGLPTNFDKNRRTLRSWSFEETFQTVPLPPNYSAILPQSLKSVFQTDQGRIVIESTYTLPPAKKK
jgi:hypothetical protein